jgi:long-chain acyl-CoA synthetase
MLVRDLLEKAAERFPEGNAAWFRGEWITYLALETKANQLAWDLIRSGLKPGDRAGILLDNGFDFLIWHFAVSKAGGVNVSLNSDLSPKAFSDQLEDCEARFLCIGQKYAGHLKSAPTTIPSEFIYWDGDAVPESSNRQTHCLLRDLDPSRNRERPPVVSQETDLASLAYTSGSTGKPKGVMLTHGNLVSNSQSIAEYLGLTSTDRMLCVLPFHYIYGQSLFYTHFWVGGSIAIENRFAYPNVALDTLSQIEATGFAGVPSTFLILLNKSNVAKRSFPNLRLVTQAGGHMPVPVRKQVAEVFHPARLVIMYGTTEAAPRLTYLDPDFLPSKWGSIGKAIPGVEVFIADENGHRLPTGTVGELVARGPNIMQGYWRDPEGTAKVLRNRLYYTGDLGRMDDEGFLFIEGRSRDILKVGGNRISTLEIEEAIQEWPGVAEVAVIGVEDALMGEVPKAFVVPAQGWNPDGFRAYLKTRLPGVKQPKYVVEVSSLPKNSAGKVIKLDLPKTDYQNNSPTFHN